MDSKDSQDNRRIVSEDLPLLLFVAVMTFVASSLLDATPELAIVSVLVATVLADVVKNRAWGPGTLLGLTGATIAGWLGHERLVTRAGAEAAAGAPSTGAMCLTAGLASVITVAAITGIEYVRDDALLVDRPTTFLSADPPPQEDAASRAGFSTAVDAITAYAERQRWAEEEGWEYAGDCGTVTPSTSGRKLICSQAWRGPDAPSLAPGERAYFIAPAFSDVHYLVLALAQSGGRWRVDRVLRQ